MIARTDINPSRTLAIGRIVMAALAAVFAVTDPGDIGLQFEFDDISVTAYFAFALLAASLIWDSWWRDFYLAPFILTADTLAFIVIPIQLEPMVAAYMVMAVLMAAFIITSSYYYWGRRVARSIAIQVNLICFLACFAVPHSGMPPMFEEMLRRVVLLASISILILWLSERSLQPAIKGYLPASLDSSADLQSEIEIMMTYAMDRGRASGAAAINDCRVELRAGSLKSSRPNSDKTLDQFGHYFEFEQMLFDIKVNRCLFFNDKNEIDARHLTLEERAVCERLGTQSGVQISVRGAGENLSILLDRVANLNRQDLFLARSISRVLREIKVQVELARTKRDLQNQRTREAIARDLHDGVSQSLAGAQYWLASLQRSVVPSSDIHNGLAKIKDTLNSEQAHVREMIAGLRLEFQEVEYNNPEDRMQILAKQLSSLWNCKVAVAFLSNPVTLRVRHAIDIEQIIREAVANAVQHGNASEIAIDVKGDQSRTVVTIADNGSGFNRQNSIALPTSIAERVRGLGGNLTVDSKSGMTVLKITFQSES